MKKVLFYLLCLCSCLCGCKKNRDYHSSPHYTIDLEEAIDNIQPIGLTEIGSSITYIPLETSDNSLLRPIRNIIVSDTYILVDDAFRILMYDLSGHFIRQIGSQGSGPGEYSTYIIDYCISLDGKNIYLLELSTYKCFEYDSEGRFLNSFKIDSMPHNMIPFKNDLYVFRPLNNPFPHYDSIQHSLIISDLHNNIRKVYKNYFKMTDRTPGSPLIDMGGHRLYSHQGNIRFKEIGMHADTLFTVTEEDLIPYAVFYYGEKYMPEELVLPLIPRGERMDTDATIRQMGYAGKYFVRSIFEDNDNLYLELYNWLTPIYGYFNKPGKTVKVIGEDGFQNDIDGGLPFWPKHIYNDNVLVGSVNAFDLREHILNSNAAEMRGKYGKNYDDLMELANSLDDESNPVLIMVKK